VFICLLNAFARDQNDRNEAGRRRIDRAGHLVNWNNTYIVRSNNDAFGHDFLVVDDLLTGEQCETLCRAFWDLVDRTHKSDEIDPFWNNRFIWFADVKITRPAAGEIMIDALQRAIELIKRFYLLRAPVYPDLLQIVKWDAGIFMLPHADNANPDGTKHMMPYRDLAGIVYLNDDYEGGELYFTAHDIAIKPRRGMFVGFTAGFHHEHAVLRVDSGTRLTMPFFLAFDSEKADRTLLQHAAA
jgi:hypothetical protein